MRRNTLLTDVGIAVVLAILVIVISPGLAVVGILALLVVVVCAVSFVLDRRRHRSRRNGGADRFGLREGQEAPRRRPSSSSRSGSSRSGSSRSGSSRPRRPPQSRR